MWNAKIKVNVVLDQEKYKLIGGFRKYSKLIFPRQRLPKNDPRKLLSAVCFKITAKKGVSIVSLIS